MTVKEKLHKYKCIAASLVLTTLVFTGGLALPAFADDAVSQPAGPVQAGPLQGGVTLEDSLPQSNDSQDNKGEKQTLELHATDLSTPQRERVERALKSLFSFTSRQPLSEDEYRKMEYGILGIVGTKSLLSRYYTVTQVLPDCPAAQAGVQVGDVQIQAGDHVFSQADSQGTYWRTMCGKAGTPVDIVVKRGEDLLTFHLVRMNIEDIHNDRIRQMYERMLSLFGPPGQ